MAPRSSLSLMIVVAHFADLAVASNKFKNFKVGDFFHKSLPQVVRLKAETQLDVLWI